MRSGINRKLIKRYPELQIKISRKSILNIGRSSVMYNLVMLRSGCSCRQMHSSFIVYNSNDIWNSLLYYTVMNITVNVSSFHPFEAWLQIRVVTKAPSELFSSVLHFYSLKLILFWILNLILIHVLSCFFL